MSDEKKLTSALNLMRRMPPSSIENSLAGLIELVPQLTDDLLNHVDQPLKIEKDIKSGREFIKCDYNRDGDSYRSPWSNLYYPSMPDGFLPSARLREMEIEANNLFDIYRKMYFEGGSHSSVYFFDTDDQGGAGFGACWLIHKDVPQKGTLQSGWWDSIHVFEVVPDKKDDFLYRLTTTVQIAMIVGDEDAKAHKIGRADLSGSMTKQNEKTAPVVSGKFGLSAVAQHVKNMGEMLEQIELTIRNGIEGIYIQKTREVINGMRSTTGQREAQWSSIANDLANTIIKRK